MPDLMIWKQILLSHDKDVVNQCKDIHKFGNKCLPSAYKTQVEFMSHFLGKKIASYGPRNTVIIGCSL